MKIWLLLAAVALSAGVNALQITEIMANPSGADSGREWVEIHNDGDETYNITEWKLVTDGASHSLNVNESNELFVNGSFLVLVQDADLFLADYPGVLNLADSSWTDLTNSANHTAAVINSTFVFDNATFFPAGEGKSLCRNDSLFYECNPTPGAENSVTVVNETNSTNTAGNCDIAASLNTDFLHESAPVVYETELGGYNCTSSPVEYWIEDLFGSVVRYVNTTQACSAVVRQWTPDEIGGSEVYSISLKVYPQCNDTNSSNNAGSRFVAVKGYQPSAASAITITGVENVKFGEAANIDIDVYRGDTAKYLVDVYVRNGDGEKLSGVSKIHLNSKYTAYKFSVPIQIDSNCDNNIHDGSYTLVAEGLDLVAESPINIAGASGNCKTIVVNTGGGGGGGSVVSTSSKYFITYPEAVHAGEEFEIIVSFNSSSRKTYSIYSYVYRGSTPVSEGFDGKSWSGTWTANAEEFIAQPGNSYDITLRSRIEEDTEPGIYSLRVKIKSDREDEVTRTIEIREKEAIGAEPSSGKLPEESNELPLTGFAVREHKDIDILVLLDAILKTGKFF